MSFITGLASFYSDIGGVLYQWNQAGIFALVLPFLLIFAIIFAILDKLPLFEHKKGVSAVIAIVVGLLSLQLPFVSDFFSIIFPKLGVGLAVVLVAMILIGAFVDWSKGWAKAIFIILGGLIFFVVILSSLSDYAWWDAWWWIQYYPAIVVGLIVIGVIIAVIATSNAGKPKT